MAKSFCRFCHAFCGIEVELRDGRAVRVRGDRDNPISKGFSCIKGRCLPEQHHHPERLRAPLQRDGEGALVPVPLERALDGIADALGGIIDRHGPRSVALYAGTAAYQNATGLPVARAWMAGIGSPSYYTSLTIDQPSKLIAPQHHGSFTSRTHSFDSADVWLVVGCNSLVSMYGGISGFPSFNPSKRVREARARGLDLIVVDPRRTELARMADLHLQVRPGEDPTLLAGMLHVILEEGLGDESFCDRYVNGLEALREAVSDFTPDYVEARAGVAAELVVEASRRFARGPRGVASSGTGPSMAPRPNLSEHLIMDLNSVCGRYNRAGDEIRNPGTLTPLPQPTTGVMPPMPGYHLGPQSRIRGLGSVAGEMPTAALADEILTPGEGQVRALIVLGGNPVAAFPDQEKTVRALRELDLLVAVDPFLTPTARLAHYVIAPALTLERADVTMLMDTWYPEAYAMYTPPVLSPPEDVVEDWAFLWELAQRMGTPLNLVGGPLDMTRRPTSDEVLDNITSLARVPLAEIRRHPGGALFPPDVPVRVAEGDRDATARLELAPPQLVAELREVRAEPSVEGAGYRPGERFGYRLISRRLREVCNSVGQELPSLRAKRPHNPAFMNPEDLRRLGVAPGVLVEIESAHGCILGVAEAADDVLAGVISMAHAWGELPEWKVSPRERGSSTSLLIDNASDYDPISGIPRQSAIPVNVRPAAASAG